MRNDEDGYPFEFEEEPNGTSHIRLTNDQAIELTVCSCLKIGARTLYKRMRLDSILNAVDHFAPGEVIAETNSAVFILSEKQAHSIPAKKALAIPDCLFGLDEKQRFLQQLLTKR